VRQRGNSYVLFNNKGKKYTLITLKEHRKKRLTEIGKGFTKQIINKSIMHSIPATLGGRNYLF
jgi:hypothetical protein